MPADRHESICHIIDKSLAGGASVQEEQSLREHLLTCAPCGEYLAASNRAIAGLQGFSFDMDPELDRRVLASLAVRAQQLEANGSIDAAAVEFLHRSCAHRGRFIRCIAACQPGYRHLACRGCAGTVWIGGLLDRAFLVLLSSVSTLTRRFARVDE
jgi:hypothetical protein